MEAIQEAITFLKKQRDAVDQAITVLSGVEQTGQGHRTRSSEHRPQQQPRKEHMRDVMKERWAARKQAGYSTL